MRRTSCRSNRPWVVVTVGVDASRAMLEREIVVMVMEEIESLVPEYGLAQRGVKGVGRVVLDLGIEPGDLSGRHAPMVAAVRESPEAKSVTSCPRRTSSSVRRETTRSVPPYSGGGTGSTSGARMAIRNPTSSCAIQRSVSAAELPWTRTQHISGLTGGQDDWLHESCPKAAPCPPESREPSPYHLSPRAQRVIIYHRFEANSR